MTPKSGVNSVFTFSHILDIAVVAGKDINALCALTVEGAFNDGMLSVSDCCERVLID